MKKIFNFTVLFFVLLLIFSCNKKEKNNEQDNAAYDMGGKEILAVTENGYFPLNFTDPKSGDNMGFEYDMVNEIANVLNAKVKWSTTSWDSMISSIKEGQFDVGMDGITITQERSNEVDFSVPYLKSQQVMLVRADESRFSTVDEFKKNESLLVGSQIGTTQYYVVLNDILDGKENNPRLKVYDNFALAVQGVLVGDLDMVLMDKISSDGYIGENKGKLKVVGESIGNEEFGLIFKKGSKLKDSFDYAINKLKENGTLATLEKKWFYEYNSK